MGIRFTSSLGQTNKFLFKKGSGVNKIKFISSTEPFGPPSGPVDTTIYDSEGNVLFTVNGNVPNDWKFSQGIAGYVEIGSSATSIGSYAFSYNQLTSVTIPDSVTTIGSSAFYNNLLTSVTIPDSVTDIGSYAFAYNQLTSVTIPDSVTSIGNYAFRNNLLNSVTIPDSVTSIGSFAFGNNTSLSAVDCYTTETAFVGSNAFYYTASPLTIHARATDATWTAGTGLSFQGNPNVTVIKDLEYPVNTILLDSVGNVLDTVSGDVPISWKNAQNIAGYVVIGSSASYIKADAFISNQLTSATISDSVTNIGSFAFAYNQLTSVTIGDSVTVIGNYAFDGNLLTSVIIPDSVTTIGSFAFAYNQLTTVTFGSSVSVLGSFAFQSNGLGPSITIPDSVTSIGNYVFDQNPITSVTIPDSVTSIGDYGFSYLFALDTVNCYTTQTAFIGTNAFLNTATFPPGPLTIYVRATDATWTAGTGLEFQGNTNVTIIKDL